MSNNQNPFNLPWRPDGNYFIHDANGLQVCETDENAIRNKILDAVNQREALLSALRECLGLLKTLSRFSEDEEDDFTVRVQAAIDKANEVLKS